MGITHGVFSPVLVHMLHEFLRALVRTDLIPVLVGNNLIIGVQHEYIAGIRQLDAIH
ncbi:hypothetical protein D3C73_1453860 [compost metagenome]